MEVREQFLLRPKTTMRIGGSARYFAELATKDDVEAAVRFAAEKSIPLLPLGSGSNTIFSDGTIDAFVVQIKHSETKGAGGQVTVGAGKNLAMLINELGEKGFDLSPLTGIPGSVGGALFGNAGQGPKGIWIDSFVETVTVYIDEVWKTLPRAACEFSYRESGFKRHSTPVIIWETALSVPPGSPAAVKASVEALLKKRIETQPHLKTAGSCFKAVGALPAWQLLDAAGLRGYKSGGIEISPKHANFLINTGEGSYADAVKVVETAKAKIPQQLEVEMRFIEQNGTLKF